MKEKIDDAKKLMNDIYSLLIQFEAKGENNVFVAFHTIRISKDLMNILDELSKESENQNK